MIPVLIPSLPETDAIVPYLRRIDQSHIYSNYGPLSREFTAKLCGFVSERAGGAPVAATITGSGTTAIELALRYRIAGRPRPALRAAGLHVHRHRRTRRSMSA